jgi:hypothetical protein
MENINPIFILQPVIVIHLCSALMIYWYRKRRFPRNELDVHSDRLRRGNRSQYALQFTYNRAGVGSGEAV